MNAPAPESSINKPPKPKRRWCQFSLRSLLLMMLVFACGLGWVAFERQKDARGEADFKAICMFAPTVTFSGSMKFRSGWLQLLFGGNSFRGVNGVQITGTKITDADLAHFKGLPNLMELSLDNTGITDAGLEHLKGLPQLWELSLENTKISDAGFADLQRALTNCDIKR